MSRIAEALKKSRGEIAQPGALDTASADAWTISDRAWDLTSAPPVPDRTPVIQTPPAREDLALPALPSTAISQEELARLVQRLFQSAAGTKGVRSVLFSTVGEQADSASLCAWTAHALAARTSDSVCVIDANLRRPGLHAVYGLPATHGLSDALMDPDPAADVGCLVARIERNLWLLPAGSRGAAALPYFVAEQLRVRLLQLLATFEYVLVDAAAAGGYTDVSVLGALVDGVVLVVEANATRRDAARRVAAQLRTANVRVLGAVLTNRTFPIPDVIYRLL